MTFGLRNAAQSFQRILDSLFRDLPYCFVYIDDILIASRKLDEHISHLKEIFRRLDENGLVLKISKCIFAKPEVDFLGHHVSASGIRPTSERTQAILDFNRPSTVKQLRKFLGMLNFYRRFLPNAAKHQTKLNDILVGIKKNKNKSIDWDEDSIKAFEYCKEQLSESTTLAHPWINLQPQALHHQLCHLVHITYKNTYEQSSKFRVRFAEPPAQYFTGSGRAVHPSK
ncbi:hypothetical protein TNCT_251911 [Trichonephila clavata]|uniref:Reverse transcriptase domain-containing protein n=1 Tax=Trichonephila clavata TaxID=2740835 RepID=A0A8X6F3K3_TRICU|nr:hypothetical protein TNCT_251911 [Trichonephila clavata]